MKLIGLMVLLYIILYIVYPYLFPKYFRISNEALGMYIVTLGVIVLIGGFCVSTRLTEWLAGDIIWLLLPCFYSSKGAYGTRVGTNITLMDTVVELCIRAALLLVFQFIILCVVHLVKKYCLKG